MIASWGSSTISPAMSSGGFRTERRVRRQEWSGGSSRGGSSSFALRMPMPRYRTSRRSPRACCSSWFYGSKTGILTRRRESTQSFEIQRRFGSASASATDEQVPRSGSPINRERCGLGRCSSSLELGPDILTSFAKRFGCALFDLLVSCTGSRTSASRASRWTLLNWWQPPKLQSVYGRTPDASPAAQLAQCHCAPIAAGSGPLSARSRLGPKA